MIPIDCLTLTNGRSETTSYSWPGSELTRTLPRLEAGRRGIQYCVKTASMKTAALYLYNGSFYNNALKIEALRRLIQSGQLRLFIISAGYGVLDAFEPAHYYEAKMEGKVAKYWRDAGLNDIISDICLSLNPVHIFGFFAGDPFWSGAGAKYRYFFTAGLRKAMQSGLKPARAGCFYRESGMGVTAILQALGNSFTDLLVAGFQDGFVEKARTRGLKYGGVVVKYEDLISGDVHASVINTGLEINNLSEADEKFENSLSGFKEQTTNQVVPVIKEKPPVSTKQSVIPGAEDFRKALEDCISRSEGTSVEIVSGDLHRRVGGYPGSNHRMVICCQVMRKAMRPRG